eukprot:237569_1
MFLGRRNILRNIVSRNNWASTICTIPFRGFAFKSSEMICARNYNIFTKEKSDTVETDQFGYFAKVVHSIFISGGWVLNGDINYNKFKLAIEESLNVLPHFGGRISGLTDEKITFYYNNQGIKFDVVCHPEFSLNPTNIEKYNNLQNALKPYNRNIFFTDDKPLVFHDEKEYEQVPIMIIQLNYLNKENMDDDGDGCIVTFKMSHGFGDGYTGYYYMKCLSDCLSGNDLSEYKKARYAQIVDLNVVDRNMSCEDFEKKWGFNYNKNGSEVLPNLVLCKHNEDEIESTQTIMDGFADSQYSGGDELEYFTLKFTRSDISEIKNKLIDNMSVNIASLTTFETIVSYLCFFISKYECKNGLLNRIFIPFNLRDRVSIFNSNNIGGCVMGVAIDIGCDMEYTASSYALKLHECLNIYSRKSKQIDIYGENNDYCKQVQELQTETCLMFLKYSYKYNTWETITEATESANIMMNEFRSIKLYDNYSFGINEKPLYYMNGTHYTIHRFMLLPSPDNDGVLVSIRMPKSKTEEFRENEKEFFDKHEEKQPLHLHEKIYNHE